MISGISKNLSQIMGAAGSIPKAQLGNINKVIGGVMSQAGGVKSLQGLNDIVGKIVDKQAIGLSPQQKEAMEMMVKSKIAAAGNAGQAVADKAGAAASKVGGAAADKIAAMGSQGSQGMAQLQQMMQQLQQQMAAITAMMEKLHQGNKGIINNIR